MNAFFQLLLNPAIVSLVAGVIIGIFASVKFPKRLVDLISLYLIFTIGFKGGACVGVASECRPALISLAFIGLIIGFLQPFINYVILKKSTSLDRINAAAVATQYGSISIVTFITALKFLSERSVVYDSFMTAIAGMMEIPALFSGLWIIKQDGQFKDGHYFKVIGDIFKSVFSCKKITIIFVGFFIGLIFRRFEIDFVNDLIIWPFNYMLILFMVDIGIKIAKQREYIHQISPALLAFAIYMPVISGIVGLLIANQMGLTLGSQLLFTLLLASASYIAVPAVIRTQTDKAKEVIYLPLALGVTLPFNILLGIPLFYYLAKLLTCS